MPQRDLDRMREILLRVQSDEMQEFGHGWVWARGDDFFSKRDDYQIVLLTQQGFLEAEGWTTASIVPDRLRITAPGHDYLDSIQDDGVWEKTKAIVADSGGSATLEIIKTLATALIKKQIKKHTDIEL